MDKKISVLIFIALCGFEQNVECVPFKETRAKIKEKYGAWKKRRHEKKTETLIGRHQTVTGRGAPKKEGLLGRLRKKEVTPPSRSRGAPHKPSPVGWKAQIKQAKKEAEQEKKRQETILLHPVEKGGQPLIARVMTAQDRYARLKKQERAAKEKVKSMERAATKMPLGKKEEIALPAIIPILKKEGHVSPQKKVKLDLPSQPAEKKEAEVKKPGLAEAEIKQVREKQKKEIEAHREWLEANPDITF